MKLLQLTVAEKKGLVVPALIGCLVGIFAAYAVFALAAEYELQSGRSPSVWVTSWEAAVMFVVCLFATVSVLGWLPIVVGRTRARRKRDA